jgi:hypothetical protein
VATPLYSITLGQVTENGMCITWLNEIKGAFNDTKGHIDLLEYSKPARNKRGLLGTWMQALFGINDEVYYDLHELQHNQEMLKEKSNSQAKLLVSTTKTLESTMHHLFDALSKKLTETIKLVNDIKDSKLNLDVVKINVNTLIARHNAGHYLAEMNRKYKALAKALLHKATIFDFMEFHQFVALKTELEKKLPSNMETISIPDDFVDVTMDDNKFVVNGYLKLVERDSYNVTSHTMTVMDTILISVGVLYWYKRRSSEQSTEGQSARA